MPKSVFCTFLACVWVASDPQEGRWLPLLVVVGNKTKKNRRKKFRKRNLHWKRRLIKTACIEFETHYLTRIGKTFLFPHLTTKTNACGRLATQRETRAESFRRLRDVRMCLVLTNLDKIWRRYWRFTSMVSIFFGNWKTFPDLVLRGPHPQLTLLYIKLAIIY